jgi:uncharacterized protein YjbI with pentapeptide repeats
MGTPRPLDGRTTKGQHSSRSRLRGTAKRSRKRDIDRAHQHAGRYSNAIELLANDKSDAQLGGLYALETLAKTDYSYQATIVEVISTFVRERAPKQDQLSGAAPDTPRAPTATVQAALSILARGTWPRKINLAGADLTLANLDSAQLVGADLSDTTLTLARFQDADLTGADLSGSDLKYASLQRADLSKARLDGVDLRDAVLSGAVLIKARLVPLPHRRANLTNTNLTNANLCEADLSFANLSGAGLTGARLEGASLDSACLVGAYLTGANLTEADLTEADLSGAYLNNADLTSGIVRSANLGSADLRGAKLIGADLNNTNVAGVIHDATTLWPIGFTAPPPPPSLGFSG